MIFIESNLRFRGLERTGSDVAAAELLYAYWLNYVLHKESEHDMRKLQRAYAKPIQVDEVDESRLII